MVFLFFFPFILSFITCASFLYVFFLLLLFVLFLLYYIFFFFSLICPLYFFFIFLYIFSKYKKKYDIFLHFFYICTFSALPTGNTNDFRHTLLLVDFSNELLIDRFANFRLVVICYRNENYKIIPVFSSTLRYSIITSTWL